MSFENATPRPWTENNTYGWLEGANGTRVTVYDLGISVSMNRPDEEERANAELIVTAVNAHEALVEFAETAIGHLSRLALFGDPSAQDLKEKAEAALKLARAES